MKTKFALSLSIFILVLCAGFATVIISQRNREDAEKSLKREESIAAARNKQILGAIERREDFERQRKLAAEDRQFKRFLNGTE